MTSLTTKLRKDYPLFTQDPELNVTAFCHYIAVHSGFEVAWKGGEITAGKMSGSFICSS